MAENEKSVGEHAKEAVKKAGEEILKACQDQGKSCGKVTLTYQIDNNEREN